MSADGALLDRTVRRSPYLAIGPELLRGPDVMHVVKDRRSARLYELGRKEVFVIARLDGTHSLADISTAYAAEFGRSLNERSWAAILSTLARRSFLDDGGRAASRGTASGSEASRGRWVKGSFLWGDPQPLLTRLHQRTRRLFTPVVAAMVLGACSVMLAWCAIALPTLLSELAIPFRHPALLVPIALLLWFSSALHEIGHGLACVHYGGRVTSIGVRWRLPMLAFFCDADDVLVMDSRRHRVITVAVGVIVNLTFLLPFFALWLVLPGATPTHGSLSALLLLGFARALPNYLPLPGLDGYRILEHATRTTDLYSQTWLYLRSSRVRRAAYPQRARRVHRWYAGLFAASVVSLFVVAALLIARTQGGARILALAAAALLALAALGTVTARRRSRRPPGAPRAPSPPSRPSPTSAPRSQPGHVTSPIDRSPPLMNTASNEPVLVARDLHKTYGETKAVAGVSLTVCSGEIFGILGPNGAGKTTLVEILEGQRMPDAGTVSVFGQSPWPRSMAVYRRVGIQSQFSAFFPDLTASEQLRTMGGLYGLDHEVADAMLKEVGLTDSAGVRVDRLSGGQRQRLAIASALVHSPDLLFLDEATAALDPAARRSLWDLLRRIRDTGCSIIYTTHHLDEAEELCDRVAIVQHGEIIAMDTPSSMIRTAGGPSRIHVPATLMSREVAGSLPGVEATERSATDVVLSTHSVSQVLAELTGLVDLSFVETRRATLEDVYLHLTGTEFTR